jgi:hypothetical protein
MDDAARALNVADSAAPAVQEIAQPQQGSAVAESAPDNRRKVRGN